MTRAIKVTEASKASKAKRVTRAIKVTEASKASKARRVTRAIKVTEANKASKARRVTRAIKVTKANRASKVFKVNVVQTARTVHLLPKETTRLKIIPLLCRLNTLMVNLQAR